jgi:ATP-dependent exoDNAse (exonuclease V) beta subunit
MALRSKKASFRFERDIGKALWNILDVYWLGKGEKSRIHSKWLQSFENMKAMEKYANDCEDFQLKGMSQVVRRYADSFPDIIYEMADINRNKAEQADFGGAILSTIHASKGQEYERVYIDSDVADMLGSAEKLDQAQYDEEVNIAYVGFTRAIRQLFISKSFERILNPKWQNFLMSCRQESRGTKRISGTAPAYVRKKAQSTGFHPAAWSQTAPFPTPAPGLQSLRRRPKVGDRVKTPHGYGVVVEMQGAEVLVKLEDQVGSLWERHSSIKFPERGE